ncbi:MAG: hypothetical protein JW779_03045 [Candidatus Thorarchaeota archaeon]|nr:hypothetical protein [Candidatus Thorarchaeota archaeon]
MQKRISIPYETSAEPSHGLTEEEPLKVNVFTSKYCAFCQEALDLARLAVDRLSFLNQKIEVVETMIDDKPGLVESLNIIALPIIQVGSTRVVGLPDQEDIEKLVQKRMFNLD